MNGERLAAAEAAIWHDACQVFTDASLDLAKIRLDSAGHGYALIPLVGMAMVSVRMRGGRWRADMIKRIERDFDDQIVVVTITWALEALEEATGE